MGKPLSNLAAILFFDSDVDWHGLHNVGLQIIELKLGSCAFRHYQKQNPHGNRMEKATIRA